MGVAKVTIKVGVLRGSFCFSADIMNGTGGAFEGGLFSPYLTTRLPGWAGVRQNVMGSTVDGRPVLPANSSTMTYATVGTSSSLDSTAAAAAAAAAMTATRLASSYMPSSGSSPSVPSSIIAEEKLLALLAELEALSRQLAALTQQVSDLREQQQQNK